jgi:WD40 repeat protein
MKRYFCVRLSGLTRVRFVILMILFSGITLAGLSQRGGSTDLSVGHVPQEIRRLHVDGYINAVAWNADGSRLATEGKFGSTITLFETSGWTKLNEFHRLGGG